MNDMHPTRWTFTIFLVFWSVMSFVPDKLEPSDWESLALLVLIAVTMLFAAFDLGVAIVAKNISRQQRRLRRINAAVLLASVVATLIGRAYFNTERVETSVDPLDVLEVDIDANPPHPSVEPQGTE